MRGKENGAIVRGANGGRRLGLCGDVFSVVLTELMISAGRYDGIKVRVSWGPFRMEKRPVLGRFACNWMGIIWFLD